MAASFWNQISGLIRIETQPFNLKMIPLEAVSLDWHFSFKQFVGLGLECYLSTSEPQPQITTT